MLPPTPARLRQYFQQRVNKIGGMLDADLLYNDLLWQETVHSISPEDQELLCTLRGENNVT